MRTKGINHARSTAGIVSPAAVNDKPIFVFSRLKPDLDYPVTFAVFLGSQLLAVPFVETSREHDLLCFRGI